jgi:hypothetical protein
MMKKLLTGVLITAVLSVATLSSADAQARSAAGAGTFGIVPFAGYLISESMVEGPLGSKLGSSSAPVIGGQLTLPLASWVSLVGTVGLSNGDLEAGAPILGNVSVGDSRTWLMDGGLELRPGGWATQGYRVIPVLQVGVGAINRQLTVAGVAAESTDLAASAGLGVDIPLGAGASIRLMARDHYGKADFGSLGSINARTDEFHTVSLSAGLRFGL